MPGSTGTSSRRSSRRAAASLPNCLRRSITVGDKEGLTWSPQGVRHPAGFAEAYATYVEGGWQALSADPEFGGQGMPLSLSIAFGEQLASANMAFSLCMILSSGAVEAPGFTLIELTT